MTASRTRADDPSNSQSSRSAGRGAFATTHWSVVLLAQDRTMAASEAALEKLCRAYWYPLYAFVRRQGHSREDAEDLTQEFFTRLLQKEYLRAASRDKGRFRTFLLVALKRFLANQWERARAQKRGGGQPLLSLDTSTAENRYRIEPADVLSADRIYERRWALTLVERAVNGLKEEFYAAGRATEFQQLKNFLVADRHEVPYSDTAARLGLTEGALRVMVHRMRKRFRELFRQEIAHTVANDSEIEAEVRHLMNVLSG